MREKISKEGFPLFTAPQFIPTSDKPDFGDRKLTPVQGNPFGPKLTPVDMNPFQ